MQSTTGWDLSGSTVHGSPHVHGLAWLPGAPDVLFTDPAAAEESHKQAIAFIDSSLLVYIYILQLHILNTI